MNIHTVKTKAEAVQIKKKRKSIYYNLPDEALMDMSFETLDVCKTVNQILPMTHKKTRTNIETNNL